jgi:hypothetical protein
MFFQLEGVIMQPYHVETVINPEGKIILSLPFPAGKKVEVVILPFEEDIEDKEWKEMALKHFLDGYADEDSVYDAL